MAERSHPTLVVAPTIRSLSIASTLAGFKHIHAYISWHFRFPETAIQILTVHFKQLKNISMNFH